MRRLIQWMDGRSMVFRVSFRDGCGGWVSCTVWHIDYAVRGTICYGMIAMSWRFTNVTTLRIPFAEPIYHH